MNELFILPRDVLKAISLEELEATVKALKEAGLYALPYSHVDIRFAGDMISRQEMTETLMKDTRIQRAIRDGMLYQSKEHLYYNLGDTFWVDYKNISLEDTNYQKFMVVEKGNRFVSPCSVNTAEGGPAYFPNERERDACADTLIVLLATRNSVKTRVHNPLAKHHIGKGSKRWSYVTTISLPKEMDSDPEHKPTGNTIAPHMRRGHIRKQHFGPANAYVKSIWIAPVFVNADPEWVAKRKAYNISTSLPL